MTSFLDRLESNRLLAFLLGAFCALAVFYSIIVPIFEGPDEDDHFRYAKFVADHRALPVQKFEPGGGEAGHQGWQPPLYYSLVALVIAPIDTGDYPQHLWRNYAATFVGDPSCCGRNIYYHPDSENFPYARTTLAVHLARFLSVFFGAVTVAATYALVNTIFDNRRIIALAAAAVVAFNPGFLFASALASNDTLLAAFSTLALLVWVRLLTGQLALTLKSITWLGTVIGLALLTKTTALGLVPLSVLVVAVVALTHHHATPSQTGEGISSGVTRQDSCDLRFAILGNVAMLIVITLLAGWWLVRNTILYGDPIAYRLMITSAIFPRAGPLTLPELFQISLPWLWQTFWGGPTPGDFTPVILVVLAILTALAFVGVAALLIRDSKFGVRSTVLALMAWLGLILVAQIQFIQTTTGADQGRYLFPAIGAIALFFVVGLMEFTHLVTRILGFKLRTANGESLIGSFVIVAFFLLALFVPLVYTVPAYARPALLSEGDLAHITRPLEITFAHQLQLLGYDLDSRSIKSGDTLRITLYWRALAPMDESYRIFVHLIGQGDRSAGGADVIPARGAFPTVYWKPGDMLRDVVQIPVAVNAAPGRYSVEVGLYPVGKPDERLTAIPSGDDRAILDSIKIAPPQAVAYSPQTRVSANFADRIELIGYDVARNQNVVQLTLYWCALSPMDRDYTVFVHVLGADGMIITQADHQPQNGNYPTSIWDVGENVRDDFTLTIPGEMPGGKHTIAVGWYDLRTGERFPVLDANHQTSNNSILLDDAAGMNR